MEIPEIDGYQYRGLNNNLKSKTGLSLLYFPVAENVGNEWRDLEQFELLEGKNLLGKKLGIYR